jgi:hypothetical protein
VLLLKEILDGGVDFLTFFGAISPTRTTERGFFSRVKVNRVFHIMRLMGKESRRRRTSNLSVLFKHRGSSVR